MSEYTVQETLMVAQGDGTALNTSTTATSILPAHAKLVFPANYFSKVGKLLKVTAQGRMSCIVTTPGTLTLDLRFASGPVVIANGGAFNMNVVAKTNVAWWLEFLMTLRAVGNGAASNFMFQGEFTSEGVVSAPAGTGQTAMLPASAPAVGASFDNSASQILDLFATFSISNASNSIQLHQYKVESLN